MKFDLSYKYDYYADPSKREEDKGGDWEEYDSDVYEEVVEEEPEEDDVDANFGSDILVGRIDFARFPNLKALAISASTMNNIALPEEEEDDVEYEARAVHPLGNIVHLRLESTSRQTPLLKIFTDDKGVTSSMLAFTQLNTDHVASNSTGLWRRRSVSSVWLYS